MRYQQELFEANKMYEKAKQLTQSHRYGCISEVARQSLVNMQAKSKRRTHIAEQRLADMLNTLAKYPLMEGLSAHAEESTEGAALDVDRLKEYMAEVKGWVSLMRAQYVCMP